MIREHSQGVPFSCIHILTHMIDSKTISNTYDKSTLDEKFQEINDKLSDLNKSLSSCVTQIKHDKDVSDAVNTALANLPKHYVTYEELKIYLKDYITSATLKNFISVDSDTVIMKQDYSLGLNYTDDIISLYTIPPYIEPTASIVVSPVMIELDHDSHVTLDITVDDMSKIKQMFITGGSFSNEDVTELMHLEDEASNTQQTTYTLTYISEKDTTKYTNCSTVIGKRVLYGDAEITAETFATMESMEAYSGVTEIRNNNPDTITIDQHDGKYGWIATPWKIKSFTDVSINLPGGWEAMPDMSLKYTECDSPYSDGLPYYIYKTFNSGLGSVTWKITNN